MSQPINQLLISPEGKTLEFKRDLSSPKNILKTLVAFANTAGGCLIVGVDDDQKLVGVAQPLDEEERLGNLIADSIEPRLVPNIDLITHQGKSLLIIEVFPSGLRPHSLKSEGAEHGVYVRLGSSSRQADRELVAELRRSAEGIVFDELPMPALTVDDLDFHAARGLFADQRVLTEHDFLTLRLLTREQGQLVPTKGAVLLFGKERQRYFPDAWVQCGRFSGKDKAHIFDHIDINAHLPLVVDQVMNFLKKHAMRGADFSEIRRKDVWSIPLLILREAVINALVHADYSQTGAPIRIAYFDDRIEIESPGILLPGMTIEDMKRGISRLRNRVIARVFRELNLIEQWGSGVRRIFSEAQALGLPEPDIQEISMRLRLTVHLAETKVIASPEALDALQSKSRLESQLESRLESKLAAKVMLVLFSQDAGKTQLSKALGNKSVSGELNKQIHRLIALHLIEMTLPDKPNSRLQKYRLTAQGRQLQQPTP